jgi:uncharacterized membrane protein YfcA
MITSAAALIAIGLLSGYFIGLVGIGAGVIMIPLLMYTGFSVQQAVAAGLFLQLIPQSLPAVYMYYKTNNFLFWESLVLVLGSLVGTLVGAYQSSHRWISDRALYIILFVLMVLSSVYVLVKHVL